MCSQNVGNVSSEPQILKIFMGGIPPDSQGVIKYEPTQTKSKLYACDVNCSISIAFILRLNFKLLFCVHSSIFGKSLSVRSGTRGKSEI